MARQRSLPYFAEPDHPTTDEAAALLRPYATPLVTDADLDPLLERIGDARYVLLGEASHGTHEFYEWRARLTRRLIAERRFSFVAVEGDWPDCARFDDFVRAAPGGGTNADDVLHAFDRWPTWMWANREVAGFGAWLRAHNAGMAIERKAGFHGLDVYSLWDSMGAVVRYLSRLDPAAARVARHAYECFAPYGRDSQEYALATRLVPTSCEAEVAHALAEARRVALSASAADTRRAFDAEQNALVARNAEAYYRAMVRGGSASWNVRDRHMVETLERLVGLYGPDAKAIVWAHNTHVGDARFCDMADLAQVNVGQLVRERHGGDGVVIVGFSSHHGAVIAGAEWDAPMERMPMPPGRAGSWEDVLHAMGHGGDRLVVFPEGGADARGEGALLEPRGHRAVGVVYRPAYERYGNYVPTVLPRRYDALLFLDETHALWPLDIPVRPDGETDETYPSGM